MNPRKFHLRRGVIHLGVQVALLALCVRMAVIQCLHQPRYASLAEGMERAVVHVPPRRGHILDREGRSLAVTTDGPSVYVNPRVVPAAERAKYAARLSQALDLEADFVLERLSRPKYFAWIARAVSDKEAEAVRALELPGVGFAAEGRRRYPQGEFLCHALGFVGVDGEGLAGLDRVYDGILSGDPGETTVWRDGLGRRLNAAGRSDRPVRHGRSLVLTVDSRIQRIVEREVDAVWDTYKPDTIAAVVMDPWTGDILAMASRPGFDPNRYSEAPPAALTNIAIADCVEPGSSFKPFVAAAAVAYGLVGPDTVFDCRQGSYRMAGRTLHDAHPLGLLPVRDVIAYSSNIGMAQICARLTPEQLHDALEAYGFGRPAGIALPGESSGILRPVDEWSKLSMSSLAMGQEIGVSALQLTAGFCVFANGGWYVTPRLVLGIADRDGRRIVESFRPIQCRRVLSEDVARLMGNDLLVGVVERGTGRHARIDGYRLAGKTGTAQIARADGGGYEPGAYSAVFAGMAPADDPLYVIGLVVKRPRGGSYYGGTVAAPAVARMVEQMLAARRIPRAPTPANVRLASTH